MNEVLATELAQQVAEQSQAPYTRQTELSKATANELVNAIDPAANLVAEVAEAGGSVVAEVAGNIFGALLEGIGNLFG